MATQVKHRRGTNAEILAGVPAIGELWFNTTDNSIHMGDGVTQGGVKQTTSVNVKGFGAKGDGVTDDTAALQAAITFANTNGLRIDLAGATYLISSELDLPVRGFVSGGKITGANVKWSFTKLINNSNAFLEFDSITIDSVWHSSFNGQIKVLGDATWLSSSAVWGVFWNNFGDWEINGKLIIDVDQGQSVNQNNWGNVRCRGLLKQGVNTTGIRECHNNHFAAIDTTGADMTASDGSTGWHVLSDSDLDQSNVIGMWYAESTGDRSIRGNWHVQGSNVDAPGGVVAVSERNHYIFSGTQTQRNNADFFAAGVVNAGIGGEWDVLHEDGSRPYSLSTFGTTTNSSPFGAADAPSGINQEYDRETSSSFSGFMINFDFPKPKDVVISLWYKGNDFANIESDGGAFTSGRPYEHSSGWKLIRFVATNVTNWVKLYLNSSGTSYRRTSINSYFCSLTKTAHLPCLKDRTIIRGNATNVSAGSTVSIPIPLFGAGSTRQTAGTLSVRIKGSASGPGFIGATGVYKAVITNSSFSGTPKTCVVTSLGEAVQGINTGATPVITVTPTTSGIDFSVGGGSFDPMGFIWEYEPMELLTL